jgi:hypothetical protein
VGHNHHDEDYARQAHLLDAIVGGQARYQSGSAQEDKDIDSSCPTANVPSSGNVGKFDRLTQVSQTLSYRFSYIRIALIEQMSYLKETMNHWMNRFLGRTLETPPAPPRPTTFEEAVDTLHAQIDPDTVSHPWFHMTGGMSVRNAFGLWDPSSPLHQHMKERFGLCHADDTGMLICHAADARKNGRTYDPTEDVERCKQHWRNMGYDPATMEQTEPSE